TAEDDAGPASEDHAVPAGGGLRRVAAARRAVPRPPFPDADPLLLRLVRRCSFWDLAEARRASLMFGSADLWACGSRLRLRRLACPVVVPPAFDLFGSLCLAGLACSPSRNKLVGDEPAWATGKGGRLAGPARQSLNSSPSLIAFSASPSSDKVVARLSSLSDPQNRDATHLTSGRAERAEAKDHNMIIWDATGMADGGGERLTTTKDVVVMAEEGRIAELESEIENEQLRRRAQGEGSRELLPVAVTVTVDLSQVDSGIVRNVTSFLGTSRELLNLALTCKSFGFRQPTSTLSWSLVEEVARQTVCSRATVVELSSLPQFASGTTTWLSILHRYEHLLVFDVLLGGCVEYLNGDKTTVRGTGSNCYYSVAVSSSYVMRSGSHYAEFQITGSSLIGIVRPMPGLDAATYQGDFSFIGDPDLFPDFLAQRSKNWGHGNVHACEYFCGDGDMRWTDWDRRYDADWERWEGMENCRTGDTVGMLLNLDDGTLSVYKNNRRLGVMKDGLSESYCWESAIYSPRYEIFGVGSPMDHLGTYRLRAGLIVISDQVRRGGVGDKPALLCWRWVGGGVTVIDCSGGWESLEQTGGKGQMLAFQAKQCGMDGGGQLWVLKSGANAMPMQCRCGGGDWWGGSGPGGGSDRLARGAWAGAGNARGKKRLRTAGDGQDVVATVEDTELRLRRRIAELESENEMLRRRDQGEGSHDVLPVVVSATVDLSRVDTSLVTQISSFLGTSRELLNLALTSKSFGFRQPTSTLNLSLVEEVARQTVCSRTTDAEMGCLPHYVSGVTTWLSILHRYEHLLVFDVLLGGYIVHQNGDKNTVFGTDDCPHHCTAVSSHCVMTSGAHYAEFHITETPYIGIARPMLTLDAATYSGGCFHFFDDDLFPDFLAQRSSGDWGDGNVHACEYFCGRGQMCWTNWDDDEGGETVLGVSWEGMEGCGSGDTIGMLLNLDEGKLTVYKNNRRLGVMKDGLSGSYCWYVIVSEDDKVVIKRGAPPGGMTLIV
ncbi:hypothetical protein THAOC_01363, partial [Thalassiosira oceanica]